MDPLSIVTEYCDGGDIKGFLAKNHITSLKQKLLWMIDITTGMVMVSKAEM